VLVLHYYVGLPARDVAAILGLPVGTTKSRIHYATEIMRSVLDADARAPITIDGRSA
jgi:DNA-directed RNA polymerase specialized sigma24 family protein